jgi:hypothetical protein
LRDRGPPTPPGGERDERAIDRDKEKNRKTRSVRGEIDDLSR